MPNFDDPGFFWKVFNLIPKSSSSKLIPGGDYNAMLDSFTGSLSTRPMAPSNSTITLNNLIGSMSLVDIWRLQHWMDKDYSFFLHVQKYYTRTDYFLIDTKLTPDINETKYHNIIISDHSLIQIKIDIGRVKPTYDWQFTYGLFIVFRLTTQVSIHPFRHAITH